MASLVQRVAKERPWVILLENVEGLLQSNAGRDLNFIRAAFASCQYLVKVRLTDAMQWGFPFMRTRVFIVAVRAEIAERLDWDSYVVPTCPLTGPRSSFPSFHDFLCPEDHDPYDDGAVGLDPSAVTWVRDGRGELLRDTVKFHDRRSPASVILLGSCPGSCFSERMVLSSRGALTCLVTSGVDQSSKTTQGPFR